MDLDTFDEQVSGIAALDHPISRRAYQLVLGRGWIGRDGAADALGVARSVAAFHLDKLVEAGLLDTRFERVSGRTGPGAGRPAKLYRRSAREIAVSLPPRRYDLAGSLLAGAVALAEIEGRPVSQTLPEVARDRGAAVGAEIENRDGLPVGPGPLLDVLDRHGYEPTRHGRRITLANCPFHTLAEEHRGLVCGMNLDFLTGVLEGSGQTETYRAQLAPEPGHCCVRLDAR